MPCFFERLAGEAEKIIVERVAHRIAIGPAVPRDEDLVEPGAGMGLRLSEAEDSDAICIEKIVGLT